MSARALFQGRTRGRNGHGINHLLVILFLDKCYGFQHCRKFSHENSRPIPERVWRYQQHKHKRLFTLEHLRTTTSFTIATKRRGKRLLPYSNVLLLVNSRKQFHPPIQVSLFHSLNHPLSRLHCCRSDHRMHFQSVQHNSRHCYN